MENNVNVDEVIGKLNAKLPAQFGIKCSNCGEIKKVSKKTFLNRVKALDGDYQLLMDHFHCKDCRKTKKVDFVGRERTKKQASVKTLTLEMIDAPVETESED